MKIKSIKLKAFLFISTSGLSLVVGASAVANPLGGSLIAGTGTISGEGSDNVIINQTSDKAIINWRDFSIGKDEKTTFNQLSKDSIILNRVTGNQASSIFGAMDANGKVFLINPNGVVFGKSSHIDVAGLVVTTSDIKNDDFLNSNYRFDILGSETAKIVNEGSITIRDAGLAAFVAPRFRNNGVINAKLGKVSIASAEKFTLDLSGEGLVKFEVGDEVARSIFNSDGTSDALVQLSGIIDATGGSINITAFSARDVVNESVNIGSEKISNGISINEDGTYSFFKGKEYTSFIEDNNIDAAKVVANKININGNKINVASNSTLNASASSDDANGGIINIIADKEFGSLIFKGTALANGGLVSGDGGLIETSGAYVNFEGSKIDTSALNGETGEWLIDPYDINIDAAAAGNISNNLTTTNVTIKTTSSGASAPAGNVVVGEGDININSDIAWSSTNSLTLDAHHSINLNAVINVNGGGKVNLITNNGGTGGDYNFGLTKDGFTGRISYNGASGLGQALSINGASYNLIYSLSGLGFNGNYALARSVVGSSYMSSFTGNIIGLGNTIDGLTISGTALSYGFIGSLQAGSVVRDIGLTNVSVKNTSSYTGAIVGFNRGTVKNVYVTGNVDGSDYTGGVVGENYGGLIVNAISKVDVTGRSYVGGVLGNLGSGSAASIANSYAYGNVSGRSSIGGLVGYVGDDANIISSSAAYGNVSSTSDSSGGLVGYIASNKNNVSDSSAYGDVSSRNGYAGGFIGTNNGNVTNSHSYGSVNSYGGGAGGFAGYNSGLIQNSSYVGDSVTSNQGAGGFVATNAGSINNSHSSTNTSSTSGIYTVGGFVGSNTGNITSSFSDGDVSVIGSANIGGFVGKNSSTGIITSSYSDADVYGRSTVGGFAGWASGTISESYSTGNVYSNANGTTYSTSDSLGGFVGYVSDGKIEYSYATGNVTGSMYGANNSVGGFAGALYSTGATSYIKNSYSLGNVIIGNNTGSRYSIGGFVGASTLGELSNNYSSGTLSCVSTCTSIGGFIGYINQGVYNNNYFDINTYSGRNGIGSSNTSTPYTGNGVTGLTTAQFNSVSNFSGFNFSSTPGTYGWVIIDSDGGLNNANGVSGATRPMLVSEYSKNISNSHQLQLMALDLSANYKITKDIDASDTNISNGIWNTSRAFITIGGGAQNFSGSLDGQDFNISNIRAIAYGNYAGLIGYNVGNLKNINLKDIYVSGNAYAIGGLVGWNSGTVEDVSTDGVIIGGGDHIGGISGVNVGEIKNANSSANINSSSWSTGGISGYNGGTISNATYDASVSTSGNVVGGIVGYNAHGNIYKSGSYNQVSGATQGAGGIVGWNEGGHIRNAWSYANIYSNGSHVGGLIGANVDGNVSYAYATGKVVGNSFSVGGLVGYNSGTIDKVYSIGNVSGAATYKGGLIGYNPGIANNSYWATDTSNQSNATGAGLASAIGLSNSQFAYSSNLSNLGITNVAGADGFVIINTNGAINNSGGYAGAFSPLLSGVYSEKISNGYQLQLIAMGLGNNYELNNNFRMFANTPFVTIGNGYSHFTGRVDGKSFAIDGLTINGSGDYSGIVAINDGEIKNLNLDNLNIYSSAYATGTIAGVNKGKITNVNVSGELGGYGESSHLGGVAGINSGIISDSNSGLSIDAANYTVGGLAGWNTGKLFNNQYDGSITAHGSQTGGISAINWGGEIDTAFVSGNIVSHNGYGLGGIVGYNIGRIKNGINYANISGLGSGQVIGGIAGYNSYIISQSYSSGNINGSAVLQSVGGVTGWNEGILNLLLSKGNVSSNGANSHVGGLSGVNSNGTINDAYVIATITANGNDVGGLVGYNSGTISRTYSAAKINGVSTYVGGLVGYNPGTISDSYWDTAVSSLTNGVGAGSSGNISGLTTSQMQTSTILTYLTNGKWDALAGVYPFLKIWGVK